MPAPARMPATVGFFWMLATAVTQATTVTPATRNIRDDSNIMTAHNSRNAFNSRNESNNRITNTVWTPLKAGMLAKAVKPATAWREANSSRDKETLQRQQQKGSRDACKAVKPATAWREANSSRDKETLQCQQQKGDLQQKGCQK
jgi:hypothetical protein